MFGKFLSKGIVSVNGMMDLLQDFGGMMVKYPLDVLDGIGAVIKKGVNWGVKALKGGGGGGPAHAH